MLLLLGLLIAGRRCRGQQRVVVVVVVSLVVQRVVELQVRRGVVVMVVGVCSGRSGRAQVVARVGGGHLLLDALVWVVYLLRNVAATCPAT